MHNHAIRRMLKRWSLKQDELGKLIGVNRGVVGTYVKEESPTTPPVKIFVDLQSLCGYQISVRQILENDFDDEELPPTYSMKDRIPKKGTIKNKPRGSRLAYNLLADHLENITKDLEEVKKQISESLPVIDLLSQEIRILKMKNVDKRKD